MFSESKAYICMHKKHVQTGQANAIILQFPLRKQDNTRLHFWLANLELQLWDQLLYMSQHNM